MVRRKTLLDSRADFSVKKILTQSYRLKHDQSAQDFSPIHAGQTSWRDLPCFPLNVLINRPHHVHPPSADVNRLLRQDRELRQELLAHWNDLVRLSAHFCQTTRQ